MSFKLIVVVNESSKNMCRKELFDYSVVIRTLGTSGDKYDQLLSSLKTQTVKPKEIIVVMAEGYAPPHGHIERERIVWTRKGMVTQRVVGFKEASSDYLLVLDDDVTFDSDFVECVYNQLISNDADCIFPNNNDIFIGGRIQRLRGLLLGTQRISWRKSEYYLRIGGTAGTIVNAWMRDDDQHWCQTANFQCFFIKRDVALKVRLEDEMWLEDTGYALPDDQVFFYKAYLMGCKTLFTPNIYFKHLDAKSGNIKKADKTFSDFYTSQRNYTIFWHRFLYGQSSHGKILLSLCLVYRTAAESLFFLAKCCVRRKLKFVLKIGKPYRDAYRFIKNSGICIQVQN